MNEVSARCPTSLRDVLASSTRRNFRKFPLSISYPRHEAIAFMLSVCDMEIRFESC